VLSLPSILSPYKVAIFPLMKKSELINIAIDINKLLMDNHIKYFYDNSSTKIGKKYVRSDEMGINYAITIDYETLEDKCITIRERDNMKQIRLSISDIIGWLETV
jgi:glycyl-tRNA synthetase